MTSKESLSYSLGSWNGAYGTHFGIKLDATTAVAGDVEGFSLQYMHCLGCFHACLVKVLVFVSLLKYFPPKIHIAIGKRST